MIGLKIFVVMCKAREIKTKLLQIEKELAKEKSPFQGT